MLRYVIILLLFKNNTFTVEALNAIRNFYTRPDVGSVTDVNFGYNTPNAANSSTINDPLSNILPTHGEIVYRSYAR